MRPALVSLVVLALVAGCGGSGDDARLLPAVPALLAAEPTVVPMADETQGYLIEYGPAEEGGPRLFIEQYTDFPPTDAPRRPAWTHTTPFSAGSIFECGGSSFVAVVAWDEPPDEAVLQAGLDEVLTALGGLCD